MSNINDAQPEAHIGDVNEKVMVPIPEDLRKQYERVKASDPTMGWRFAIPLYTRIARAEATVAELEATNSRLKKSLEMIYAKWENGTPCSEAIDGVIDEDGSHIGNAFNLSCAEEQEILNLIVDKAEDFEQACANCNKPYRAHLLHDGNKCSPNEKAAWFPAHLAAAIARAKGEVKG